MRVATLLARAAAIALALIALSGIHAASAQTASPQTSGQTGIVSGTVTEKGNPLAEVEVRIDGTDLHTRTDAQGKYVIVGVPVGTHTVRALRVGYLAGTENVTVAAGGAVQANIKMEATAIPLEAVEVTVGSRAHHTAADELAVPVDVYDREELARQGSTETSQALQTLSPSVNFPRQSVTDATDVVRPFTLRGLSPDHTLVLMNGWRQHQTALVNTFAYGTGAGSSGVDLNAIPSSAIERVEVLRDGASAEYGSDAIAGVVNIVTRSGRIQPFANATAGQHFTTTGYPNDGKLVNGSAGFGVPIRRGSLGLFAEVLHRDPTNRAWADAFDVSGTGLADSVGPDGQVIVKRNQVEQPNQHWGDGLEQDILTFANLKLPLNDEQTRQFYAFGGYSFRRGSGQGYRRYETDARNWPQIYPLGFLPEFHPDVTDYSGTAGFKATRDKWNTDLGLSYGHNDFEYNLKNTLNASLGPSLSTPTGPATIPNQTEFFAGRMKRDELVGQVNVTTQRELGLPSPLHIAFGAAYRHERFAIERGELASYIDGGVPDQFGGDAPGGSQVFAGFSPTDESSSSRDNLGAYGDLETDLTSRLLVNGAARYEHYSDFGSLVTGKLATRFQPTKRLVLRAAASNGFRAPGLSQVHFSKVVTNVIGGVPEEIGVFPVDSPAAKLLGAKPLKEEKSVNLSAGVAITPRDGLTLTADAFHIKITDRILLAATFDDSVTQAILAAGGFSDITGVQYFTNGLDTRTRGVDLTADWRIRLGDSHTLGLIGALNYTENKITRVDALPDVLVQNNSAETGLLDTVTKLAIEKERPDYRATVTAEWALNRIHALARAAYYGKFSSAQPGYCDACEETYGAKTLVDAEAGYKFRYLDIMVGARNLLDTYPDKAKLDFNNNFGTFPWAAASPFGYNGRYVYTKISASAAGF